MRLRSSTFDIVAIVAYFPPPQRQQVDHWNLTVSRLANWLHRTIQSIPKRCPNVAGADANCEFGKTTCGGGTIQYTADDTHTGRHNIATESFASAGLWRIMKTEGIAVIYTLHQTGPTYFGQEADHRTHPDHFFAPVGVVRNHIVLYAYAAP